MSTRFLPQRLTVPIYKIKYFPEYKIMLQKIPIMVYTSITEVNICNQCSLKIRCESNIYPLTSFNGFGDVYWNNHGCFSYDEHLQRIYRKTLYRVYVGPITIKCQK